MDGEKFDALLKRICTTRLTRISALRGLVAGAAAALTGAAIASDETDAKKKEAAPRRSETAPTKARPRRAVRARAASACARSRLRAATPTFRIPC